MTTNLTILVSFGNFFFFFFGCVNDLLMAWLGSATKSLWFIKNTLKRCLEQWSLAWELSCPAAMRSPSPPPPKQGIQLVTQYVIWTLCNMYSGISDIKHINQTKLNILIIYRNVQSQHFILVTGLISDATWGNSEHCHLSLQAKYYSAALSTLKSILTSIQLHSTETFLCMVENKYHSGHIGPPPIGPQNRKKWFG